MHKYTLESKDGTGTVIVSGELTIQYTDELKTLLLKAFDTCKEVKIDLERLTEIDVSGLQIFCAAHKTGEALKKQLYLAGACPDILARAVDEAGFNRIEGCTENCFWVRGE